MSRAREEGQEKLFPPDLLSLLGSPLESQRSIGVSKCGERPDLCTPGALLALTDSDNSFLVTSVVTLLGRAGHVHKIARALASWYSHDLCPHAITPNPEDNDKYWKGRNCRPHKLGQSLLIRTALRLSEEDPVQFIDGLAEVGDDLRYHREILMSDWPAGLHYVYLNQSFSPLLFIRSVLECGKDWWNKAVFVRTDIAKEEQHTVVPPLTPAEIDKSAPMAWEEDRFMFGYFLPMWPQILSFSWLVSEVLYWLLYDLCERHLPLPEVASSIESLEDLLHYHHLPHVSMYPFIRIVKLINRPALVRSQVGFPEVRPQVADIYTDRLAKMLMNTSPDLLGVHRNDRWGVQYAAIYEEYVNLQSNEQLVGWRQKFTVWLYSLLLQDQSCLGGWRDEAILRSSPDSPEAYQLAWRIVDKYGVTSPDKKTFDDKSLGSNVLVSLLAVGDICAFRLLKSLLLEDNMPPTYGICFGFRLFLQALSGAGNYHRRIEEIRIDIGNRWETLCRKAATVLFGQLLLNPLLVNGKRVDIVPNSQEISWKRNRILYAPKAIECKKSLRPSEEVIMGIIGKYSGFCDSLEIWVLEKSDKEDGFPTSSLNGLEIVYGEDLAERVKPLDPKLAEDIIGLCREGNQMSLDARLLREGSRDLYTEEVIQEILDLNEYLGPYYSKFGVQIDT